MPSLLQIPWISRGWTLAVIHVSMSFFQIIPALPLPTPPHRVQKTVLYVCVSFAVSHTGLSLLSFLKGKTNPRSPEAHSSD